MVYVVSGHNLGQGSYQKVTLSVWTTPLHRNAAPESIVGIGAYRQESTLPIQHTNSFDVLLVIPFGFSQLFHHVFESGLASVENLNALIFSALMQTVADQFVKCPDWVRLASRR